MKYVIIFNLILVLLSVTIVVYIVLETEPTSMLSTFTSSQDETLNHQYADNVTFRSKL